MRSPVPSRPITFKVRCGMCLHDFDVVGEKEPGIYFCSDCDVEREPMNEKTKSREESKAEYIEKATAGLGEDPCGLAQAFAIAVKRAIELSWDAGYVTGYTDSTRRATEIINTTDLRGDNRG